MCVKIANKAKARYMNTTKLPRYMNSAFNSKNWSHVAIF
jgi:hypothetical protein